LLVIETIDLRMHGANIRMVFLCFLPSRSNSRRVNKAVSYCQVGLLIRESKEMVTEDKRIQKGPIESLAISVPNVISPRFYTP
jgi:hypothetical protein